MKFTFDDSLPHQRQALDTVVDLFRGQELGHGAFTVLAPSAGDQQALPGGGETGLRGIVGRANRCSLGDADFLANLNAVQAENGLPQDAELLRRDFTVEMETGTGKTYVYLRSALELHRRYGFTKFVVVVPSVAIREGVMKSVEMLRDHFARLYDGAVFNAFEYDSGRLGRLRTFATADTIEIMVVTVGAINRDTNLLYRPTEGLGMDRPIDVIRNTRPIVIVDEPQSVFGDAGFGRSKAKGQGRKAVEGFEALATFRYSATPPKNDGSHLIYRLDAIDAYEARLVKQIEVASLTETGAGLTGYVRVKEIRTAPSGLTASVELDVVSKQGKVSRKAKTLRHGDDLAEMTGNPVYTGAQVAEISLQSGRAGLYLTTEERPIPPGGAIGETLLADDDARLKIAKTIREHLDKELTFAREGLDIKVLSLFFIDEVAKYREYGEDGEPTAGRYQEMFEQEYARLAAEPAYQPLRAAGMPVDGSQAHEGYFSIDKRGRSVDTVDSNAAGRDNAQRAYELIMRNKEQLTSRDEPLRFIFSHSALREGWDNPNVFQICTLRTVSSVGRRRQMIGRGLRLAVAGDGRRTTGHQINRLTVIADESYEVFAAGLQKELSEDLGIQFGVVTEDLFANLRVESVGADGEVAVAPLGLDQSQQLRNALHQQGYVDERGEVQDSLRRALAEDAVELPAEFEHIRAGVLGLLRKVARSLDVKRDDLRYEIGRPTPERLDSPEFSQLWERISQRTVYRIDIDDEALIRDCTRALAEVRVTARRVSWETAEVQQDRSGVSTLLTANARAEDVPLAGPLPDILTELQNRTGMTRRSLGRILLEADSLQQFTRNPVEYVAAVAEIINHRKEQALVGGISYEALVGEAYPREHLAEEELIGYLKDTVVMDEAGEQPLVLLKSVWPHAVVDSAVEARFVKDLEAAAEVTLYAKLPAWFTIPTPMGSYNPDWAVVVREDGREHLYFVVETKGVDDVEALPPVQRGKVLAARQHFDRLSTMWSDSRPVEYAMVSDMEHLQARW